MPPPGEPDPYAALARFYDLDHAGFDADLDFWRNLAKIVDGPVLEIGSGTGRVLFPLARSGVEVVGVDSSPAMLARARAHLAADPALREWVTLCEADVRTLRLDGGARFPLAISALAASVTCSTTATRCARSPASARTWRRAACSASTCPTR